MLSLSLRNRGDKLDAPSQGGFLPRTQLETGSNDIPGSRCRPVKSSPVDRRPRQWIPGPYRVRPSDGMPRSTSRHKDSQFRNRGHRSRAKPTQRNRRTYARLHWSGRQRTTKLQIVTQRQRRLHRPQDLRRAGSVSGTGLRAVSTRTQPATNGSLMVPGQRKNFQMVKRPIWHTKDSTKHFDS
jgi:hypothetical protein